MATPLNNTVEVNGLYNGIAMDQMTATLAAQVQMLTVAIAKTANPMVWAGDGELTYTISVTNNDTAPLTSLVLTDTLNTTLTTFVDGSVQVGGALVPPASVGYVAESGLLTIQVPDIPVGETSNITFRVAKI